MNIESKHSAFSSQRSAYFIQKQLVAWHRLWPWPLATLREWPRCANDAGTFPINTSISVGLAH
ncbi:MAG: hypothetical protein F6K50_32455 [Moorea sp. SIO3I7]|nr:hypothetical protein [Moorena sp. SIO3I7]NEO95300.1 hypothetical protein [Moorena sp. SIO3G5]